MSQQISARRQFVTGLLAGIMAAIAFYVGTELLGLPYPPEAIFRLLIAPVPGSIQSIAVDTLREYAKYGTLVFASAIFAVLYGIIGVALGLLADHKRTNWQLLVFGIIITTVLGLTLETVLAPSAAILSSSIGWVLAATLMIIINAGYSYVVVSSIGGTLLQNRRVVAIGSPGRRKWLKRIGIGIVSLVVLYGLSKLGLSLFSGQPLVRSNTPIPINSQPTPTDLSGVPSIFKDPRISNLVDSEVTDNRAFYRVDIDPTPPQLDFDQWSLKVSGKVNKEITITKNDLLGMTTADEYVTLECVSNTINPPSALISNAKWTGVPLSALLNRAGISSNAKYVVFHCADGYSVGISLDRALNPDALLAYKMNDEPLPKEHGFPLRAIVPGIYGMMNAKWITGIEVVDYVYLGYWQERGWSNDARIKTTSIIYYPPAQAQVSATLPIAGIAFAGDRGISRVEVSTNGGKTWNEAILKKPRSPTSWVLWAYEWTPTTKGDIMIVVRATDGIGQLQNPTVTDPFPEGASGYHSIDVTVT